MYRSPRPITNYALIRYLEQVNGLDIDALCTQIRARVDAGVAEDQGIVVSDDLRFKLRDGVVTAVQPCPQAPDQEGGL